MKLQLIIFTTIITLSFPIFSNSTPEIQDNKIQLFTSIIPQKYFADRIGGDRVITDVLVGPGKSPATYQPTPKQIIKLSSSKVLFTIGVPFEKAYLEKTISTLKDLKVVDTSKGITKRKISEHHHEGEENEDEEHNDIHENSDPHVWLSPVFAKQISKNILETLIELDPEGKEYFTKQYNNVITDLENCTNELHSILDPLKGKTVFVYHPSFGYFLDEFGMEQEAVETGGKAPTPQQLEQVIDEAREDGVKIIIVQPEFSLKSAEIIANSINGTVTTLNPLAEDYISNLKSIATNISIAYK